MLVNDPPPLFGKFIIVALRYWDMLRGVVGAITRDMCSLQENVRTCTMLLLKHMPSSSTLTRTLARACE